MPTRYYFHLENRQDDIRDDEGVEADSSEDAVEQALSVIDELRSKGELPGSDEVWSLVITDDEDNVIQKIVV